MLNSAAGRNFTGGAIYDCLHAQCAVKAKAEALYTWDVRDFQRIAPPGLRVLQPLDLAG
jgi:predicted nucleic acid-binding protein